MTEETRPVIMRMLLPRIIRSTCSVRAKVRISRCGLVPVKRRFWKRPGCVRFQPAARHLLGNVRERFECSAAHQRGCTHLTQIDDIDQRHQRPGLAAIVLATSTAFLLYRYQQSDQVTYRLIGNGEGSPWQAATSPPSSRKEPCTTQSSN